MKIKKINLLDISILQLCIMIIAFNDWGSLVIFSQVLAFAVSSLYYLKNHCLKVNVDAYKYMKYKGFFILWAAFGIFTSIYSNIVLSILIALCLRTMTGITILLYVIDNEKRIKFIRYLIIAGCLLCLRMLIVVPINAWGTERVGVYLSHNNVISYNFTGVTFAIGLIAEFLFYEKEAIKNTKLRIIFILVFSIFSLLTGSKKQIFFLIISISIYIICISKSFIKLIKNIVIGSIILFILGILIFKIEALYNVIGERFIAFLSYFSNQNNTADASTVSRALYLEEAWRIFKIYPIFGVGLDCFRYFNTYAECWAENNFMELLADTGLIGVIIYYFIYLEIFKGLIKRIKKFHYFLDIQILIVFVCILIVDLTMVSYPSSILQLHLTFLYATSIISRKNVNKLKERIYRGKR